ncbi:MAG: arginine decarboxylase [delta proteobacterium ML8_F1]|nr:MAG: arginine decarboxylase [delta proteobacterium ML8_F1]
MLNQSRMPLIEALESYDREKVIPFDVPGHKHGKGLDGFHQFLKHYGMTLDVNSMKSLDIISNPTSVIKEAEELLARAYGGDYSFFMIGGTTAAVQAMIMAGVKPGEKIILPRNAHKSALNGLILSGAVPVYIQPTINEKLGIAMGITRESLERALDENPDAKAVFIINPTYYGFTSDLAVLTELAHSRGVLVLADEAHGAHFPFNPQMPLSAMKAGCDISSVSLHKTGGSLTQSSALIMRENPYVSYPHMRGTINLSLTTSASYLLMGSLDYARQTLVTRGEKILGDLLGTVRIYREKINRIPGMYAFAREVLDGNGAMDFDETKLTINLGELKLTGYEVYDLLRERYHIQAELADDHNVLFILSLGDDEESLEPLYQALKAIGEEYHGGNKFNFIKRMKNPEGIVSPRNAYYANKKSLPLDEVVGEVSGESIMVYPPGIPIIAPGERFSQEIVDYIKFLKKQKAMMTGPEDNSLSQIKVLGM